MIIFEQSPKNRGAAPAWANCDHLRRCAIYPLSAASKIHIHRRNAHALVVFYMKAAVSDLQTRCQVQTARSAIR